MRSESSKRSPSVSRVILPLGQIRPLVDSLIRALAALQRLHNLRVVFEGCLDLVIHFS